MFQRNKITTPGIAAWASILFSLPFGLSIWLSTLSLPQTIIGFLGLAIVTFLVIKYLIETLIERKIKLLYKFIFQTKATHKQETYYKYILPKKSIDQVEEDVQKWAERNKEELEVLRTNDQFRKEFLQNLSHEFKTPIFAIQGYVDILKDLDMQDEKLKHRYLKKATKNIERLTNLLGDLDEISKLERGELKLIKENFTIQDSVREIFESISILAEQKNIHCSIKKGCETPITVFADKIKINQVLLNLVKNSIKYGKQNGHIVASMYRTDGNNVLVEISDDGIGIEEANVGRVFERFYRTAEGRSIDVTGSGLGLAICKHIIEAHKQNIHVRSSKDVGTTVGFTLENKKE